MIEDRRLALDIGHRTRCYGRHGIPSLKEANEKGKKKKEN
jgi:hypothetical protein